MEVNGTITTLWLDSKVLLGNQANTPTKRPVLIYIPTHLQVPAAQLPQLYYLAPWTNAGRASFDWKPFKESLAARVERLMSQGLIPPVAVICPDVYTDFGGTQYIDSSFFGAHGRFVAEEVVGLVDQHLGARTPCRAVFGRSSGGFGALRLAMDYPGVFTAVAAHSADLGFEQMFGTDVLMLCDKLRRFDLQIPRFLSYCRTATKLSSSDIHALMLLGSAGFYSANHQHPNGFDLPIDLYSGRRNDDVWRRWLAHDPIRCLDDVANVKTLQSLKYLYAECGLRDQYRLLYGARQFHQRCTQLDIAHDYEEFDDDHSGTDYRFDVSLPRLIAAMHSSDAH